MNRRIKKMIGMLLLPLLGVVLGFPMQLYAQEISCEVSIPVKVEVTGTTEISEYELVMESVSEDAPMPENATITVKSGEVNAFGPMTYTVPGDYQYTIYRKTEKKNISHMMLPFIL